MAHRLYVGTIGEGHVPQSRRRRSLSPRLRGHVRRVPRPRPGRTSPPAGHALSRQRTGSVRQHRRRRELDEAAGTAGRLAGVVAVDRAATAGSHRRRHLSVAPVSLGGRWADLERGGGAAGAGVSASDVDIASPPSSAIPPMPNHLVGRRRDRRRTPQPRRRTQLAADRQRTQLARHPRPRGCARGGGEVAAVTGRDEQ